MADPSPTLVDSLLEQCILLLEGGDQAAVDALMAAHAEVAPALRERLEQLAGLGILQPPREASPIPEQLGDFRLLRQIGRGGMGIVYLAEQTPLQRQVALKLVHPEQLFFRGARERFRREVLAIARLQHPGIVPILTCGEAEGIPFYAMDLVQGASIAEVLAQLAGTAPQALDGRSLRAALQRAMSEKKDLAGVDEAPLFHGSWPSVCCRLIADAATALQHAHAHGVLHRDVKPSNLLLTSSGRVRVIDFGLASAEGEQRITRSGATMGSVPYMAPEQVRGDTARIDARTDVYALGVTLYELLTLSLPHGDGSGHTREAILAGHVEPPSRRNAAVHADAEAVCLKAMDLDPGRRYQTVAELGDDLQAFLEHRTVRARRPSPLLRARRWARREPMRAAAATVAFVLLVPGPLLFAWQQNQAAGRIQRALDDVDEQRRSAEAEQRRAEFNLQQALDAVDQMLSRTAEARLAEIPRTVRLRRQLLQDAVDFHERLLAGAGAGSDARVRLERARAQIRLGSLQGELGSLEVAGTMLQDAVTALEALVAAAPPVEQAPAELARALERLATIQGRMDRPAEHDAALHRAMELYEALAAQSGDPRQLEGGARVRFGLAVAIGRRGDADRAQQLLDDLEQRLGSPAFAALPAQKQQLLSVHLDNARAMVHASAGDTEAALQAFERALQRADEPAANAAADADLAATRLGVLERLGLICYQRRQWDRATPWLDRAVTDYERLLADEPEVLTWQTRLARVLGSRATCRRMLGRSAEALADHDRCVDLLTHAAQLAPDDLESQRTLAIGIAERADCRTRCGDPEGALADYELCERTFVAAIALAPHDAQTRSNRVAALANHASAVAGQGDFGPARRIAAQAKELARELPGPVAAESLIQLLMQESQYAQRDGDLDASIELMAAAALRAEEFLHERPDDLPRQQTATVIAINHGVLHVSQQQHPEAIEVWEQALPVARTAAAAGPSGKGMLAMLLLRLADVATRDGDVATARRWFAAALAETQATSAQLEGYAPLPDLFTNPDLLDLLPADHPDRRPDAGTRQK